MKTVAVVQARMGSARLPGKVMMPLAGRPMALHVLQRAARAPGVDDVVLATSDRPSDDDFAAAITQAGIRVFRGSEDDVLDRFWRAAASADADVVVRITGDCPLLSPEITGMVIRAFHGAAGSVDYASNCQRRTFPRGLDTEVMTMDALTQAQREARSPAEREHVTPFIWQHPTRFRLLDVVGDPDYSAMRWTVDTAEDFDLVRRIFDELGADFDWRDVLEAFDRHPEWRDINRHVEQKKLSS